MNDNTKGLREPVLTPGESWHLGRMDALQAAAKVVRKYARNNGSAVTKLVREMDQDICEMADNAVAGYYEAAGKALATDVPAVVYDPDMGVPMLVRPVPLEGGWGTIDLPDIGGGPSMVLAAPFRKLDLNALPEGTRLVKVRDPAHSALAAVIEVLECMRRDMDAAAMASSEAAAITRLSSLLVVHSTAATLAVDKLEEDDFSEWVVSIPDVIDISRAPAAIAAATTKAHAQAAVAMKVCALWLESVCERGLDAAEGKRIEHMTSMVDEATASLRLLLNGMNHFLAGTGSEDVDLMVVTKHAQGAIPVLAVIPKGASKLLRLHPDTGA